MIRIPIIVLLTLLFPVVAQAADLDGATLSLLWGIPFLGILLSIALFPVFLPRMWHAHFGKLTLVWTLLFLVPFTATFGGGAFVAIVTHALLAEYIPFIILIFALYTISGGILLTGTLQATPKLNTGLLALGTILASIMGTTGAAMLLIRPLLRANVRRIRYVHVVIFFIFLVANIGGSLTPLGDPPLFLGFLNGVDFTWTLTHMAKPMVFASIVLLIVFYGLDSYFFKREKRAIQERALLESQQEKLPLALHGKRNFILLAGVVAAVLLSGVWKSGVEFDLFGTSVTLQDACRDVALLLLAWASLKWTPKQVRAGNEFNWEPVLEVGKLFAGIFITIAPVLAILRAGVQGDLAVLVRWVSNEHGAPINAMYFWMTGILSSFLDNAPTYLVFFNLADGNSATMMGPLAQTLLAISMGSVFMGANTYIGNAPNFMIKAIAEQRQLKMPSFFGYMAWSCAILIPLFIVLTWLFF